MENLQSLDWLGKLERGSVYVVSPSQKMESRELRALDAQLSEFGKQYGVEFFIVSPGLEIFNPAVVSSSLQRIAASLEALEKHFLDPESTLPSEP